MPSNVYDSLILKAVRTPAKGAARDPRTDTATRGWGRPLLDLEELVLNSGGNRAVTRTVCTTATGVELQGAGDAEKGSPGRRGESPSSQVVSVTTVLKKLPASMPAASEDTRGLLSTSCRLRAAAPPADRLPLVPQRPSIKPGAPAPVRPDAPSYTDPPSS